MKKIIILISIIIFIIVFFNIGYIHAVCAAFMHRPRDCSIQELKPFIKEEFAQCPNDIYDVRAAKTPVVRGIDSADFRFIVKFKTKPDSAEKFVNSIPIERRYKIINSVCSSSGDDNRKSQFGFEPKWFLSPIAKGEMVTTGINCELYIDTANKEYYIVYLSGYHKVW